MASADAAATCEVAVSEELVAARSQIASLTFEARDMEAVNRALFIKVGKLEATVEKQIQVYLADAEHQLKEMQLADVYVKVAQKKLDEAVKKIEQLDEKVEQLTTENAEIIKENGGLWHEVVGWAVQDCKRRRLK